MSSPACEPFLILSQILLNNVKYEMDSGRMLWDLIQ